MQHWLGPIEELLESLIGSTRGDRDAAVAYLRKAGADRHGKDAPEYATVAGCPLITALKFLVPKISPEPIAAAAPPPTKHTEEHDNVCCRCQDEIGERGIACETCAASAHGQCARSTPHIADDSENAPMRTQPAARATAAARHKAKWTIARTTLPLTDATGKQVGRGTPLSAAQVYGQPVPSGHVGVHFMHPDAEAPSEFPDAHNAGIKHKYHSPTQAQAAIWPTVHILWNRCGIPIRPGHR